jgi:ubiquinone/menaquinone biosynthesis C-methylase UbiE
MMNTAESDKLARIERDHWFHRGKRQIASHWLKEYGNLVQTSLLVDCGAGSGIFAREMAECCRVIAIDDREEAVAITEKNLGADRVRRGSCTALPLETSSAECITALDAIGRVEHDWLAIQEFTRVLKPGGILMVTVPASQMLGNDCDEALRHHRRYDRESLASCLSHPELRLMHCRYINVLAFPAVFAARKMRSLVKSARENPRTDFTRLEDRIPPAALNEMLRNAFVKLGCQRKMNFPFGAGLLAVARKRK